MRRSGCPCRQGRATMRRGKGLAQARNIPSVDCAARSRRKNARAGGKVSEIIGSANVHKRTKRAADDCLRVIQLLFSMNLSGSVLDLRSDELLAHLLRPTMESSDLYAIRASIGIKQLAAYAHAGTKANDLREPSRGPRTGQCHDAKRHSAPRRIGERPRKRRVFVPIHKVCCGGAVNTCESMSCLS